MTVPFPRGYVGTNHETIGSDIIAVLSVLRLPELVLGKELYAELRGIKADEWYPIGKMLTVLELLDQKLGRSALFSTGQAVFRTSHEAKAKAAFKSAHALVHAFDALYKHANRGENIGGWKVMAWSPGRAELEKTTPHHCAMEEGIMHRALECVGVTAQVVQTTCIRKGADHCRYLVTSPVVDARWGP